jgi:hypothetical protein
VESQNSNNGFTSALFGVRRTGWARLPKSLKTFTFKELGSLHGTDGLSCRRGIGRCLTHVLPRLCFQVLFTLAKENYNDSWKVAVLTVVVDFLLIMAIMFNLEYPWAVDPHNG